MAYSVKRGDDLFDNLDARQALAKSEELIAEAQGDVYIYDKFGDPMGLEELDEAAHNEDLPNA